jgi:hypothetical protein
MADGNRFEIATNLQGLVPRPILAGELLAPEVQLIPLEDKKAYLNHHECPPAQHIASVMRRVIQPKPQHGNRLGKRAQ